MVPERAATAHHCKQLLIHFSVKFSLEQSKPYNSGSECNNATFLYSGSGCISYVTDHVAIGSIVLDLPCIFLLVFVSQNSQVGNETDHDKTTCAT